MRKASYQLREGVNLVHHGEDFYLLSEFPLIAVKVNKALYDILCAMGRSNLLSSSVEKDRPLIDLLDKLVAKGLLTKDETIETQIYPPISIIIPVKNRPDIRDCLNSLELLDYPKDKIEVIVVDDGSTDSTAQVIQTFKIKAIHLTHTIGASACRNLAVKEAKGELIGFIDGDCVAHPHWLRELFPHFEDRAIGIVGGYVSNFYSHSLLDRYEDAKSPLNMGPNSVRTDGAKPSNFYVPSCNLIVRKKAFLEAGGFQEDLNVGEDVDLCWRVRKLGYHLLYLPQGEVKHKHRKDLRHMLARRYDYGTSEAILYLRHKDKRKMLYVPAWYSVFYGSICLGIIIQSPLFFVFGLGIFLIDFFRKHAKIKKNELGLRSSKVFLAALRSYFSFFYLTSSYLVRYYLIFLMPLSFLYSNIWAFLLFLLIFSAVVDFSIKRPKINFFSFLFFYTLDQLAYQTGVLWGCIREKNFMSYVPIILQKPKYISNVTE
jgi:mycofactocin system glycosyltransferase